MTGRGCAIGQSGSGKSFLIGVIAEELSKLNMPFCIVDTEGEYNSLKNLFNIIVVGSAGSDLGIDVDYSKLFSASIVNNVPIILDVSDVTNKSQVVYDALSALYNLENEIRRPYLVIIEEADKFAPQVVSKNMNIIEEISVRGRKRGIGLFIATQRPANISKNVLAQCSYGFIGKLTIDNDFNAIRILFENRKKMTGITTLGVGEFVPFGLGDREKFRVREREAKHIGTTPIVGQIPTSSTKVSRIIDELSRIHAFEPLEKPSRNVKTMPSSSIREELIHVSFTLRDAQEYAERITRKKFVMFGKAVERVDSVKLEYLPLGLCGLRIPTLRKNEYLEYYALLTEKCELVEMKNGLNFVKTATQKPLRLKEQELAVLSRITSTAKVKINEIEKSTKLKREEIERVIKKLKKNKLVFENDGMYSADSYRAFLLKERLQTDKEDIDRDMLISNGMKRKDAEICINNFFPSSVLIDYRIVYLPVYLITLKTDNKVRVFTLDGINGKAVNIS